uniref:FLYWCH-type domain-containing protein n=3 Tax=Cacopsylla melanoneura TaxID=428564 RepID=A0A8D8LKN5_9HEMI
MIYDGYKYRFSTPLSVKGGKNWCCTVVKCRGYLKTEMSLGELVLIPVRKHSHPRVSLKRQSNTVESDKDKREDKPVDDTIPVNKSLTPSPFTSQIVESNVGQNSNDSNYQTWMPLLSNVYNTDTILLPQTYSVQSVGLTPNTSTSNNSQTNSTFNETPQLTLSTAELKNQVNGLIKVIVKKQMEIDRLQAKSDADEKLLADLVEHITELESKHTEAKDRINSLEYQIALRDACSCGPAPGLY